jgi:hypothetical protein
VTYIRLLCSQSHGRDYLPEVESILHFLIVGRRGESVTMWAEVLQDGTRGRKESLGLAGGLKPLHASLSLAGGLVGVLCSIIEIPVLEMFHSWENFLLGRSVALLFIGDDDSRHVRQAREQLAKEPLCGPLVLAALHQDNQHVPLLIHGTLQIVTFSLDRQKHLVHMPLVARPGASAAQLIRVLLAKLAAPLADGFIGHDHSTFKQELFHIPKAQSL